jgi:predicted metalloprotease with PDZ domain
MNQLINVIHLPELNEKLRTYSLYKSEEFFGYGIAFHNKSIPATLPSHKLVYPFLDIENFSPASDAGMKTGQRLVAVNGGYVNKDYQSLRDIVTAIEDSYYNRNFTDITVLESEMWNNFMENPTFLSQYTS